MPPRYKTDFGVESHRTMSTWHRGKVAPSGGVIVNNACMMLHKKKCSSGSKEASCGIRTHDLPLTERVLCQLS